MTRTRIGSSRVSAARIITGIGAIFALVEVIHILLVLLGANAENAFARFIRSIADPLAVFFPGLFPIDNPQVAVLVNYGLAAVFWLVVTGLVARLFFH
jgi:hypothetical protein